MRLEPHEGWYDKIDREQRELREHLAQDVPAVSEGSPCPTCKRRVPYKKKATSPQTKVVSIRIPIGDVDSFKEMLEAAATHLRLAEKPHSPYWTVLHGLVQILQGPSGEEG